MCCAILELLGHSPELSPQFNGPVEHDLASVETERVVSERKGNAMDSISVVAPLPVALPLPKVLNQERMQDSQASLVTPILNAEGTFTSDSSSSWRLHLASAPPDVVDNLDQEERRRGFAVCNNLCNHSIDYTGSMTYDNDFQNLFHKNQPSGRTTMMVRNVPILYTAEKLMLELPPSLNYDFLYVPFSWRKKCNLSYAFINFRSEESALMFKRMWHTQRLATFRAAKALNISYAKLQGLKSNLLQLKATGLKDVDVHVCKPVIFACGVRVSLEAALHALDSSTQAPGIILQ